MRDSVLSKSQILLFLSTFLLLLSAVTATRTRAEVDTEVSLIRTYLQLKNEYEAQQRQYLSIDSHLDYSSKLGLQGQRIMYVNSTADTLTADNSTAGSPAAGNSTAETPVTTEESGWHNSDLKVILEGFGYSFTFIFMSEIGDKTFIFVMLYAAKMNGFLLTFVASFVL